MNRDRSTTQMGIAIGGLAPILVAILLVPLREEFVSTNLALILVVVVVLVAVVGGRAAGAVAAVTAAMSFDFFLTRPYLTMRITSADDIETALLLLVVGLVVGQLAVQSSRHRAEAEAGRSEIQRIHRIVDLVARNERPEGVVRAAQTELVGLLGLRACRFEAAPHGLTLPELDRSGSVSGRSEWRLARGEFELPAGGVALPVSSQGQQIGRFVLDSSAGAGVSLEARIVAVAIADQVGTALIGARVEELEHLPDIPPEQTS